MRYKDLKKTTSNIFILQFMKNRIDFHCQVSCLYFTNSKDKTQSERSLTHFPSGFTAICRVFGLFSTLSNWPIQGSGCPSSVTQGLDIVSLLPCISTWTPKLSAQSKKHSKLRGNVRFFYSVSLVVHLNRVTLIAFLIFIYIWFSEKFF